MHLFIDAFVWKKDKLHYISYTNFILEAISINFWQIWHFDVKDTGWVCIILKQTVERFDMSLGLDNTVNMKKQYIENFYYYAKARLISFTQSTNIDKVEIFYLRT